MPYQTITDIKTPDFEGEPGVSIIEQDARALRTMLVDSDGDALVTVISSLGGPVLRRAISAATVGDNEIIAAVANKRIAVMAYFVIANGTVDVRFEDGAGGEGFTGQIPLLVSQGWVESAGALPLWIGTAGQMLNMELSAAIAVRGGISYLVIE